MAGRNEPRSDLPLPKAAHSEHFHCSFIYTWVCVCVWGIRATTALITPVSLAPTLSLLGEGGRWAPGIATSSSWKGIRCHKCQLMLVEVCSGTSSLPPAAGVSFSRSQCQPPLSLQENHLHDRFPQSEHRVHKDLRSEASSMASASE